MRIGKEFKSDTQLIILSVIILTIVTLSFSYSAFFAVQSLSTVQEISTGNLDVTVTVDNQHSITEGDEIFPSSTEDVTNGTGGNYSVLNLLNKGDLDADFSVTLSYDFDKLREISEYSKMSDSELTNYLVSFSYLKVGIYDTVKGSWVNFSSGSGETFYPTVSSLTPSSSSNYSYPILRDMVYSEASNSADNTKKYQRTYRIYVWLSDETPTSEIGKYVYLKLNIKSAAGNETITEEVTGIG